MRVGQKCAVYPVSLSGYNLEQKGKKSREMRTGRIVYINRKHYWVRVAFDFFGKTLYECFKPEEVMLRNG